MNSIDCKLHPFSPLRQLKNSYCQYNWGKISPKCSSARRTEKWPKCNSVEIHEKSFLTDFGKAVLKNNILSDLKGNQICSTVLIKCPATVSQLNKLQI